MQQSKNRQRQDYFSSVPSSPMNTTPMDEHITCFNPNLVWHKENGPHKESLFDPTRKTGCKPLHPTCMLPEKTFTHIEKPNYWNASEVNVQGRI